MNNRTNVSGIQQIYAGDTVDHITIGVEIDGVMQDMSVAGWECRVQLLDSNRDRVGAERLAPDTKLVDTDTVFNPKMLLSEAALIVNTLERIRPVAYWWSMEIRNVALDYERTTEIELAVTKKP